MDTLKKIASGATLAELQGMTEELGRAIAGLAADELAAGRTSTARRLLEGLVVTNPHDPAGWVLLATLEKRRGRPLAARVCAAIAHRLAPGDAQVRLVRAETLLGDPDARPAARAELVALATEGGAVGARATALLTALGA